MSRDADRPEPDPRAARPDRRQQAVLVVGAQDDRDAGRWLLERLEQRGLGVLVHPMRRFDDRHARAALERQQHELADRGRGRRGPSRRDRR